MIGENFINNEDSFRIVITTDKTIKSFVKGYYAYKDLRKMKIAYKQRINHCNGARKCL